jgi:arsenite oxidase small subunit
MSAELSRRNFLKLGGGVAAGTGAALAGIANAAPVADAGSTVLPYKPRVVAKAKSLKTDLPVTFTFPDPASPCALIKTGRRVPGGVGPDGDIVAYSTLCTHMGCPVSYDAKAHTFKCPCHYSIFDPEMNGQMVCGQATENLPQVELKYNPADDSVTAIAVTGLIYGRQSNIL